MLESLKRIFDISEVEISKDKKQVSEHDVRVATCALFVEMARIDEKFTRAEVDTILSILRENGSRGCFEFFCTALSPCSNLC